MRVPKVAILTSGGPAPCLNAAIASLTTFIQASHPDTNIVAFPDGYLGLLAGRTLHFTASVCHVIESLYSHGGTAIGTSRVRLADRADCARKGFVSSGDDPLDIAADNLARTGVQALFVLGGDGSLANAARLDERLRSRGVQIAVVGMPKTIDNDIWPVGQSLGFATAAEESAAFQARIACEGSSSPRHLLVHEVAGRHSGALTAEAAWRYQERLRRQELTPLLFLSPRRLDIHAVYLPELKIDFNSEAPRLKRLMDQLGCVNVMVAEGCFKLRDVPGASLVPATHKGSDGVPASCAEAFAGGIAEAIGADKWLVQRSGYFVRSAPANTEDRRLIARCAQLAVMSALNRKSGVVGHDESTTHDLRLIDFCKLRGGKGYDPNIPRFQKLMQRLGQADSVVRSEPGAVAQ